MQCLAGPTWVSATKPRLTAEERREPQIMNGSRRLRVAQGSGTTTNEVNQLLKQFGDEPVGYRPRTGSPYGTAMPPAAVRASSSVQRPTLSPAFSFLGELRLDL